MGLAHSLYRFANGLELIEEDSPPVKFVRVFNHLQHELHGGIPHYKNDDRWFTYRDLRCSLQWRRDTPLLSISSKARIDNRVTVFTKDDMEIIKEFLEKNGVTLSEDRRTDRESFSDFILCQGKGIFYYD